MKKIVIAASMMLFGTSGAWALGTTAGTPISNSASLDYSAGGVSQPTVNTQTPDTFVVDKKIDMLLVTSDADQQSGALGQQNVITHFQFQNEGNMDQNFTFTMTNLATGSAAANQADYDTDADSNNVNNLEVSCDGGTNWYATGALTMEFNATDPVTVVDCQVRADIPASGSAVDGDIMNIELVATAVKADGSDETNTNGTADNKGLVDVVFADGVNDSSLGSHASGKGDTAENGKEAARSGYIVKTPVLDLTKTSCVYYDPVNHTIKPKRIPGAIILYVLDINNTGTLDANDITINDTLQNDLVGGTVTNVKTDENATTTPCACSDGSHYTIGGTAGTATNTGAGQNVKVEHVNVGAADHTCVSFEVNVK